MITRRNMITGAAILASIPSKSFAQFSNSSSQNKNTFKKLLSHSVCEIVSPKGRGTGFFFCFSKENSQEILFGIVTNKHVSHMDGPIELVYLNENQMNPMPLPNFHSRLVSHPDPNVDLCVSFCTNDLSLSNAQTFSALTYDFIPNRNKIDTFDPASKVLVVGYPDGIIDKSHGQPLFRDGITASSPGLKFDGQRLFLIDAAIWGGSSGSPVFLYDVPNDTLMSPITPILIGVVFANGLQNINLPNQQNAPDYEHSAPNNIGLCLASDAIYDLAKETAAVYPDLVNHGLYVPEYESFQI